MSLKHFKKNSLLRSLDYLILRTCEKGVVQWGSEAISGSEMEEKLHFLEHMARTSSKIEDKGKWRVHELLSSITFCYVDSPEHRRFLLAEVRFQYGEMVANLRSTC